MYQGCALAAGDPMTLINRYIGLVLEREKSAAVAPPVVSSNGKKSRASARAQLPSRGPPSRSRARRIGERAWGVRAGGAIR